ncbi:hypothetical protein PENTCL1PPCAC_7094, partial [Pristionchus entomophagus]
RFNRDSATEGIDPFILENLREKETVPLPLAPDFYKQIMNFPDEEFVPPTRPVRDSATEATVKKILNDSQGLISKAALKMVASDAVNVIGPQYHDLVNLSVDEAAIIQGREKTINASRKKANALRKRST